MAPDMVQLALRTSELCTKPIPLLKEGMDHSINLSKEQVACLLAHAFFCTPLLNSRMSMHSNHPDIDFYRGVKARLFEGSSPKKMEKLKSLLCYFRSVTEQASWAPPTVPELSDQFSEIICQTDRQTMLILHSAVLIMWTLATCLWAEGSQVQEEICFLINPEVIDSRLFTEALEHNKCLIITALLQMLAAAEAGRDVAYFTFGDSDLMTDFHTMHSFLTCTPSSHRDKSADVFGLLGQYYSSVCQSCLTRHPDISLYSFIYQEVGSGSP
eukprot:XP_014062610.1 PREDICTED: poly(ADP-ribose) glycohydrolase-like [Salmo salar]